MSNDQFSTSVATALVIENDSESQNMVSVYQHNHIQHHANGNGVMKGGALPRETVVNFGFSEEPIPPSHYCCGKFKLHKVCRIVGIFSLIGFIINLVLYFMGLSKLGLSGYLETFLLIFDFIAVFTLLYGVSKKRSGMLKPYLFYNTIWSFGLIILFLAFMWQIVKGSHDVSRNLLENIYSLRNTREDDYHYHRPSYSTTVAVLVTLGVVSAMLSTIIVDCLFLHIVYRTFQFFAYTEDKRREEMDKKERL
ncbi:unnamed protein product [Caenorhabditis angaria]|uniref:Uncharacterized protein n=1 Tax=Caenorhabditis angaria TaxID=860376 RepID=A0A9P1J5S6_9PELO|nr:unnamed protein product [Caenorhabditis angaria]